MKKLKRLNKAKLAFDMLEKEMTVINDSDELKSYTGGDYYYDSSGNLISQTPTGDQLFVVINGVTKNLTEAGAQIQQNVVNNNFLSGTPFSSGVTMNSSSSGDVSGLSANGSLIIGANSYILSNYSSLESSIAHEKYHFDNNHYMIDNFTQQQQKQNEVNTYEHQIGLPGYLDTSNSYRSAVAVQLHLSRQAAGIESTIEQAKVDCLVQGY